MPVILHLTVARKIIVLVQIYDKIERVWLRLSIELLCGSQKLRADAFQRPLVELGMIFHFCVLLLALI